MSWAKHKLGWALAGGVLVSAIAFVTVALGAFDSNTAKEQDAGAVSSEADGVGEGIQVHGDWVIEVRNADGSVAERREFENALTSQGQILLAGSLAREFHPGVWGVGIRGNDPTDSTCETADPISLCLIREPISSFLDSYPATHFTTLTVARQQNPTEVVLQGNYDAPSDGVIVRVQTFNCFGPADPTLCNNIQLITDTTLGTPVNVVAGQQVLVTVRISFS
jgi:hypothetical protein